jgi:hypothetical protein
MQTTRRPAPGPRCPPGAGARGSSRCAAGRALAGRGAALRRRSTHRRVALEGVFGQEHLGVARVAGDHAVDVALGRHREVAADVQEQRPRRAGEVVAVGRQAGDHGLAGAQHGRVVGARVGARRCRQDLGSELPVDGSTELIHGVYPRPLSAGSDGLRAHPPFLETPTSPGTSAIGNTRALETERGSIGKRVSSRAGSRAGASLPVRRLSATYAGRAPRQSLLLQRVVGRARGRARDGPRARAPPGSRRA